MILKMDKDKSLRVTAHGNTYEDENNAEIIKIIVPKFINDTDLKDCSVYLNILNHEEVGDVIDITHFLSEHNDILYFCDLDMTNNFTYMSGEIKLWITVTNSEKEMYAKSDIVVYKVKPHYDVEEYIPKQNFTAFQQWQVEIGGEFEKIKEIKDDVIQYADITAHPAIIGENGNWFTWDAEKDKYTDSGKKGEGKDGEDGYTPVRGTDYWTEADKAEIKSYVDEAILGGAW